MRENCSGKRNTVYWGAFFAGLLSFAAIGEEPQAPQAASAAATVQLENAWVRAMPSSQKTTAAYVTLVNTGETATGVTGGRADIARSVEIHTTRKVDGYVRMQQLRGVALAAGESVSLAPGGMHLMLLGLTYMPVPGDTIELCLQLLDGSEVCTTAETRRNAP